MRIAIIGTGYVGLVSGVMMSHLGHDVTCIDTNKETINQLQQRQSPIYEPNLHQYLISAIDKNQLTFTSEYNDALLDIDCIFITVGTPQRDNGNANLNFIFTAIDNISPYLNMRTSIIIKSTVPPGTCKHIKDILVQKGILNNIISNPEFLREGNAVQDFLTPDRIVVGACSDDAFDMMRILYKPLTDQDVPLIETDLNSAELIKYASNSFLANKIAFINEMADLCEIVDADINILSHAIGLDKRIGSAFLKAGPGFGGSCFPKDILALQKLTQRLDSDFLILDAIINANSNRPKAIVDKILSIMHGSIKGKKIAVWGLAYKAGTDDIRNSPAIDIIKILHTNLAQVTAYDPQAMNKTQAEHPTLHCVDSAMLASVDSDAIIITTEWPIFQAINLSQLRKIVKTPIIIDLRNLLDAKHVISQGFDYFTIGKKYTTI